MDLKGRKERRRFQSGFKLRLLNPINDDLMFTMSRLIAISACFSARLVIYNVFNVSLFISIYLSIYAVNSISSQIFFCTGI